MKVYMDDVEFSQLLAALHTLRPKRVLEWGSGGSTVALLKHCPYIETMVSVEHDKRWFEHVVSNIQDPRLTLQLVEPQKYQDIFEKSCCQKNLVTRWGVKRAFERFKDLAEQDASAMADYIRKPRSLHPSYDFILVDGRARIHCLKEGYEPLKPGGVMMLHDAQRPEYLATLSSLPHIFLHPWSRGQLCLIPKPA